MRSVRINHKTPFYMPFDELLDAPGTAECECKYKGE